MVVPMLRGMHCCWSLLDVVNCLPIPFLGQLLGRCIVGALHATSDSGSSTPLEIKKAPMWSGVFARLWQDANENAVWLLVDLSRRQTTAEHRDRRAGSTSAWPPGVKRAEFHRWGPSLVAASSATTTHPVEFRSPPG